MNYITIPGTGVNLYDGAVVVLSEYPNARWILHYGWFNYNNEQLNGWYFASIPEQVCMPLHLVDLTHCTVITTNQQSGQPQPTPPCPPFPPFPPFPPEPPVPEDLKATINKAFITVNSIEERDKLDVSNLPNGKIVKVNNSDIAYFTWNIATQAWDVADLEKVKLIDGLGDQVDDAISDIQDIEDQIFDINDQIDKLSDNIISTEESLEAHEDSPVTDESGAHDIRVSDGHVEYYDSATDEWKPSTYGRFKNAVEEAVYSANYSRNPTDLVIPGEVTYVKDFEYSTNRTYSEVYPNLSYNSNNGRYSLSGSTAVSTSSLYSSNMLTYLDGAETVGPTIRHLILEEGVKQIGFNAFSYQYNLDRIDFPDSLEWVHPMAFYGTAWESTRQYNNELYCGKVLYKLYSQGSSQPYYLAVTDLNIREGTVSISSMLVPASHNWTSPGGIFRGLRSVTFPQSLKGIGDYAFSCVCYTGNPGQGSSISTVFSDIPDSVSWIGKYAFQFSYISFNKLPASLEYVHEGSFQTCKFLHGLTIPDRCKVIDNDAFQSCQITSLDLGQGVEVLKSSAFNSVQLLTSVTIPRSVKYIGDHCFAGCFDLAYVYLPNTIDDISGTAFAGCSSISTVIVEPGFNAPYLNLQNSTRYSKQILEDIIDNLADRTNSYPGTFLIGSTNISKISSEKLNILANKNWSYS